MRLIIAEKPSVAQSIAAVLGATKKCDGYLEGNGNIVSWCYGHLAELSNAAAYNPAYAKWSMKDLPIVPDPFQYTIRKDKRKQFDILKSLMHRKDVTEVVNACDSGREGEAIFRTVYNLSGCRKPMSRLWISSMEDDAIRDGFSALRPGKDYDGLYLAAKCRSEADWLVGINATRYFSLLYGPKLNIGRVVSPTLALLVQREAEIAAFVPEPFYTIQLDCGFTAVSDRKKDRSEAESIKEMCAGKTAVVKSMESKEKSEKAPALYDLTTLQRDANRILGYTAQQTLDYLQNLYEKKLCTYPRTDSRFLTDDMEVSVPELVAAATAICGVLPVSENAKQVCNSKKVSDHHAIVPTISAKTADLAALPLGERELLKLVAMELLRAVSEAYRYTETIIMVECCGHSFTAKGRTVLDLGWRSFERIADEKADSLPNVVDGQGLAVVSAAVKSGKTAPPKHYTEDTILSAMETAGAKDMPADAERKGIGTPATRAGILEKLVVSGFVERKKQKKTSYLIPTALGTAIITVLPEQLQSPLLTAEWEHKLKQIERGELDAQTFIEGISAMVRGLIQTYEIISGAEVLFPTGRTSLGNCPRCGSAVTESKKGFFCECNDCRFGLWHDNKYLTSKKISLSTKMVEKLLKERKVLVRNIFSERTGSSYDAYLLLNDDGARTSFALDFEKDSAE